jgi:hypothetical protein
MKISFTCAYPEMGILPSLVTSFYNACLGKDTPTVMFALMAQKEGKFTVYLRTVLEVGKSCMFR